MATEREPWLRIYDPIREDPETGEMVPLTSAQEAAIREFAMIEYGLRTLRGFHMILRQAEWTYYDILRAVSP